MQINILDEIHEALKRCQYFQDLYEENRSDLDKEPDWQKPLDIKAMAEELDDRDRQVTHERVVFLDYYAAVVHARELIMLAIKNKEDNEIAPNLRGLEAKLSVLDQGIEQMKEFKYRLPPQFS